ncbi:MAG: hypothetical protein WDN26_00745 [Chitinophagaceae bacterium]
MGKQLDSLADLVSFGVAPAIIIYNFCGGVMFRTKAPWIPQLYGCFLHFYCLAPLRGDWQDLI